MRTALFLLLLLPLSAHSETVINYDDGSTLTLTDGEAVYVLKGKVYQHKSYQNGKHILLSKPVRAMTSIVMSMLERELRSKAR